MKEQFVRMCRAAAKTLASVGCVAAAISAALPAPAEVSKKDGVARAAAAGRPLRLLVIGNSFSQQVESGNYGFPEATRKLGRTIDFAHLYHGGATLQQHYSNRASASWYTTVHTSFDSEVNPFKNGAVADNSLVSILSGYDWDIISVQQGSTDSPYAERYEPYMGQLMNLIAEKAPNAEVKFHQTWAYDRDSTILSGRPFGGNVEEREWMYDSIREAVDGVASEYGLAVVASGYATQLYRYRLPVRTFADDPCFGDHRHFGNEGKYLELLTWCQHYYGEMPAKEDLSGVPSAEHEAIMRDCAREAGSATDFSYYGQGTVDFSWTATLKNDDGTLLGTLTTTNGACFAVTDPTDPDNREFSGWLVGDATAALPSATVAAMKVYDDVTLTAAWVGGPIDRSGRTPTAFGWEKEVVEGDATYLVQAYTNTASAGFAWTVPADMTAQALIVAGGGGGGYSGTANWGAGGGGAGAARAIPSLQLASGTQVRIVVGKGGAAATANQTPAENGGNSSLTVGGTVYEVLGGGGGVGGGYTAASGGCGGGTSLGGTAGGGSEFGGAGAVGSNTTGAGSTQRFAGGGGGAKPEDGGKPFGVKSGATLVSANGGKGGDGLASSITGQSETFGGGGGGGASTTSHVGGAGGAGGGGNGGGVNRATDGVDGYGGGGGGMCAKSGAPGRGGSGIVIVRYLVSGRGEEPQVDPEHPIVPLELSKIFQSNMVIQRDRTVRVWGKGPMGETVTVSFAGQTATSAAIGEDDLWEAAFARPFAANPEGQQLKVTCSDGATITLDDVLVGDVWIAAGQSNMVMPVKGSGYGDTYDADATVADMANHPQIRWMAMDIKYGQALTPEPYEVKGGAWGKAAGSLSAVAYHFAHDCVTAHPEIPVGIVGAYCNALALGYWKPGGTKTLWNCQLAPITRFAVRGAIWYQGESDAEGTRLRDHRYYSTNGLEPMVAAWRQEFGVEAADFPFYFVQIAGYLNNSSADDPSGDDDYAYRAVRESMFWARRHIENCGMVVAWDCGRLKLDGETDLVCQHPKCKSVLGKRLALLALRNVYGDNVVAESPYWTETVTDGNGNIRVKFDMNGSAGLTTALKNWDDAAWPVKTTGEPLKGFAVAGSDKVWHWADAVIESTDTIRLSSADVAKPLYVRYCYRNNPVGGIANGYNEEMLPIAPIATEYSWYDDVRKDGGEDPEPPTPIDPDPPTPVTGEDWGYSNRVTVSGTDYMVVVFTNTSKALSWSLPSEVMAIDYLVVGGGGAGGTGGTYNGGQGGGGGGAGGVLHGNTAASGELVIKVGIGGAAARQIGTIYQWSAAEGGSNSVLRVGATEFVANGGGCGGDEASAGSSGGSGGGGGSKSKCAGGAGVDGQGFAGASGSSAGGGGGGGATGAGASTVGGAGYDDPLTGMTFACGGAGGHGEASAIVSGVSGLPATGNGGGGAFGNKASGATAGDGGSGVVVIRYAVGGETPEPPPTHVHALGPWTLKTEPTCTEDGVSNRVCTASGCTSPVYEETAVAPKLGHDWGKWEVVTEATATTPGEKRHYCTREGCDAFEAEEIPATGGDDPVPPTPVTGEGWGYSNKVTVAGADYMVVVFTNTEKEISWQLPTDVTSIRYLVVGGGAAGGNSGGAYYGAGGGGGGGAVTNGVRGVASGATISVNVGRGGIGTNDQNVAGENGGDSSLSVGGESFVARGGGGGASYKAAAKSNGTGGGGCGGKLAGGSGSQGGDGGCGGTTSQNYVGGGGGGADGDGADAVDNVSGGNGGAGVYDDITGDSGACYGGGGGGGAGNAMTPGVGGVGGGGDGGQGQKTTGANGKPGTSFGGGGGGAQRNGASGGNGYQGVVIIRYALGGTPEPQPDPVVPGKESKAYETEAAAKAAAPKAVTPSAAVAEAFANPAAREAYVACFAIKTRQNAAGQWVNVAELTEEAEATLQRQVDGGAVKVVDALAGDTLTLDSVMPGFYYGLEFGDGLKTMTTEEQEFKLATGATLELSLPKGETSGFYRVVVRETE